MIDLLKADISKYSANAVDLAKDIASLEEDIAAFTGDIKAATTVREIEKAHFDKEYRDYMESEQAIDEGIDEVQQNMDGKASFVQLSKIQRLNLVPLNAKQSID